MSGIQGHQVHPGPLPRVIGSGQCEKTKQMALWGRQQEGGRVTPQNLARHERAKLSSAAVLVFLPLSVCSPGQGGGSRLLRACALLPPRTVSQGPSSATFPFWVVSKQNFMSAEQEGVLEAMVSCSCYMRMACEVHFVQAFPLPQDQNPQGQDQKLYF